MCPLVTGLRLLPTPWMPLALTACSAPWAGGTHRTGTRRTTGYLNSTSDCRTGQRWGDGGERGGQGWGGCFRVCVLGMESSALPAFISRLGSRKNPFGAAGSCPALQIPKCLVCGTGLIIPVSIHSAGTVDLRGLSVWLLCLAASG